MNGLIDIVIAENIAGIEYWLFAVNVKLFNAGLLVVGLPSAYLARDYDHINIMEKR